MIALILICSFSFAVSFNTQLSARWRTPSSVTMMADSYKVTVINKKRGSEETFDCPSDKFILDEAEVAIPAFIPWSCRAGSCSSCLGKLVSGEVDQSGQVRGSLLPIILVLMPVSSR